jgi:DNA repair photolyase
MRPISNPPNPWLSTHVEYLDEPPPAELHVYEELAHSALSENDSPDIGFRWSVNPYRGCAHACAYCYARPTHQYLGFGAGTDFERRIVVKTNIHERLALELARPSWKRETVVFSGNTDCYQPLEASYGLTRRCLEVCRARRTPVGIVTKGTLVRRDLDVLSELARGPGASVFVSIPFLDEETGRLVEPGAPSPRRRLETLKLLSEAGIETGVAIAPLIPGLNESEIAGILAAARGAGATKAFLTLLRLPAEVLPVFRERLAAAFPERARKVENALREMKDGAWNRSAFGERMRGSGPRWDALEQLFEIQCRRLGLNRKRVGERSARAPVQGELFAP